MPEKKNLRTIDNASAYSLVNAAYKQAVGSEAVNTLTLDDFADSGVAYASLSAGRDKFVKALIDQVVNFYSDYSYKNNYNDPYYVESRRYANIVQMLSAKAPEVQESHAWKNLAPYDDQGTTKKVTIGTYEVNPPIVDSVYYTKTISWELPIAITEEQLVDAFKSGEELRGFVDWIFVVVENALIQHREDMNAANRNAFIADKILYAGGVGAQGIHVVNLLTEYNAQRGKSIATVAAFMADPEAMRFASAQMLLYTKYLKKQSTLFNTRGLVKFVPEGRLVTEINSAFESALFETAYSDTYHDEMVRLSEYYSTPYWQGFGVNAAAGESTPATYAAGFDQVTKIDVSVAAGDVSKSGIVALMADKYAIMHTIRNERVASQYFSMENITLYAYQNRDAYMENLGQNAVVFTVEAPAT